jgi:16S rRNA G966 N2-methylase RsmD
MDINYKLLKMDIEGEYSLTHKDEADKISNIIKEKFGDIVIFDGTGGAGGNTISFGINFSKVISCEINPNRYNILKENIKTFNLNIETYNDDFMNNLNRNYDLIFIDPPWGGPNYKYEKKVNIKINNLNLNKITNIIKAKNKIVVWKLPFNYDLDEFSDFNYEIHSIKNYNIIIIQF